MSTRPLTVHRVRPRLGPAREKGRFCEPYMLASVPGPSYWLTCYLRVLSSVKRDIIQRPALRASVSRRTVACCTPVQCVKDIAPSYSNTVRTRPKSRPKAFVHVYYGIETPAPTAQT